MAARQLVAALAVASLQIAAAQIEDEATCTAAGADNFAARLAAGAFYGECLPVSAVLVFDGSEYADATAFPDRKGLVGEDCVHPEHFTGSLTVGGTGCSSSNPAGCTAPTSNCPVGWNCNIVSDPDNAAHRGYGLQACRNGLYCHKGGARSAGVCEECAGCTGASCGNCKTTFYPRVDQYSVMRLADSCAPQMDPAKGIAAEPPETKGCDAIMGCMTVGTKCVPGPLTGTTTGSTTDLKAPTCPADGCPDGHTIFRAPSAADKIVAQEFFVEMGLEGNGNAVVRSPIAVFSDKDFEATAMYLKAGVLNGIPRKVSWEQTGLITTACAHKVTWPLSRSNVRDNITAACASIDDHCGVPGPISGKWPMTDCGFGTYEGYYPADGKFAGMTWPDGTEGAPSDDCSQTFCAEEPPDPGPDVNPIQLYMTWAGTAADARDMSSGGLTYESFRQYSAFEGLSAAKDAFKGVAACSRECVTNKQCDTSTCGGD